jgi:nitrogen fixation/metabolism regulation signal transduction histidine kinase
VGPLLRGGPHHQRALAGPGLILLLLLSAAWLGANLLLLRHLRALVRVSRSLAAGDLSARSGLRHGHHAVGQLATAFDEMASALEQRNVERSRLMEEDRT